jgi:uncharacterized membrane protein YfcA
MMGSREAIVRAARVCFRQSEGALTIVLICVVAASSAIEMHRWTTGDLQAGTQLIAELLIFASALIGSIGGFAFSAFAGGALAHLFTDPVQSVQVLAMCSMAIQGYSVIRLWRSIQWRLVARFVAGGVLTAPLAVHWLTRLSSPAFSTTLGIFLVAYGAYMLFRRTHRPVETGAWADVAAGALGGITGGLAAFPGAFVVPWCSLRGYDKTTARGICQPYILLMQIVVLACIRSRSISFDLGIATIAYIAMALLATHLGIAVFRALTNRQFCLLVHGMLIVSGVALVVRVH